MRVNVADMLAGGYIEAPVVGAAASTCARRILTTPHVGRVLGLGLVAFSRYNLPLHTKKEWASPPLSVLAEQTARLHVGAAKAAATAPPERAATGLLSTQAAAHHALDRHRSDPGHRCFR